MKETNNTESLNKIAEFIKPFGFYEIGRRGVFCHAKYGSAMFDLSASDPEPVCIMDHILKRAVELGEYKKMEEIQKVLGITKQ